MNYPSGLYQGLAVPLSAHGKQFKQNVAQGC